MQFRARLFLLPRLVSALWGLVAGEASEPFPSGTQLSLQAILIRLPGQLRGRGLRALSKAVASAVPIQYPTLGRPVSPRLLADIHGPSHICCMGWCAPPPGDPGSTPENSDPESRPPPLYGPAIFTKWFPRSPSIGVDPTGGR